MGSPSWFETQLLGTLYRKVLTFLCISSSSSSSLKQQSYAMNLRSENQWADQALNSSSGWARLIKHFP